MLGSEARVGVGQMCEAAMGVPRGATECRKCVIHPFSVAAVELTVSRRSDDRHCFGVHGMCARS